MPGGQHAARLVQTPGWSLSSNTTQHWGVGLFHGGVCWAVAVWSRNTIKGEPHARTSQVTFTRKTRPVLYFAVVMSRFHGVSCGHLCADTSMGAVHGLFYKADRAEEGQWLLWGRSSVITSCRGLLRLLASVEVNFGHVSSPAGSPNYEDIFGSFS